MDKFNDTDFINYEYNAFLDLYINDDNRVYNYLKTLNNNDIKALIISKIMLESSFSIEKSIGFLDYCKNNN